MFECSLDACWMVQSRCWLSPPWLVIRAKDPQQKEMLEGTSPLAPTHLAKQGSKCSSMNCHVKDKKKEEEKKKKAKMKTMTKTMRGVKEDLNINKSMCEL